MIGRIGASTRRYLLAGFDVLAGLALTALLAIVSASILSRLLFDLSSGRINLLFAGAIELASYALLITVFAALPRAIPAGLVKVEVFSGKGLPSLCTGLDRLWLSVLAVCAGVLAWRYAAQMWLTLRRGDTSQDLQFPLYGLFGYVSLACCGLAIVTVWRVFSRESDS